LVQLKTKESSPSAVAFIGLDMRLDPVEIQWFSRNDVPSAALRKSCACRKLRIAVSIAASSPQHFDHQLHLFPLMSQPSSAAASSKPTVVIGGTIAIDHVKTPDAEASDLLGGSAAYAALAASFFSRPIELVGIIGHDFPQRHLAMLENHGISLAGVERSVNESFTWTGEYHANMNERTTHRVGLNVLEDWSVKVPASAAASSIVVLANMSPDNQIEMLSQCGISLDSVPGVPSDRFVIADTMDLWIEIANERLHDVLPNLDLFVLNEGEARDLAGTSNLVRAGRLLLEKGPRHVVVKLGEFGAMLFSKGGEVFRCSAWPLDSVADPTGAGDTFLGAIAGYLAAQGPPPYDPSALRQAIIKGSILASFTCEAFSTRRLENLTITDLEKRISDFRQATHW
jgi:sugar/nucleoside kinase (ribokinase family)